MSIINDLKYDLHISGDCGEDCEYCKLEEDVNSEYYETDNKNEKIAKFRKNEKILKKS